MLRSGASSEADESFKYPGAEDENDLFSDVDLSVDAKSRVVFVRRRGRELLVRVSRGVCEYERKYV